MKNILVTGGCGFIGSNFINHTFDEELYNIINVDALYYCSNTQNIHKHIRDSEKYSFIKGNICSKELISKVLKDHQINIIVHFAAQSHVQNSFDDSMQYTYDNILGTHNLLECCRLNSEKIEKFILISTDEVYGESMISDDEKKKN